ncbi:MAG: flagellar L-ring protein FlgH [Herbaspirillum sp.]|jgi:flagellar L-ring protein precursor FlgH|nr:flagellar L-ring protein FlgH [Herbaspirillum sp.]
MFLIGPRGLNGCVMNMFTGFRLIAAGAIAAAVLTGCGVVVPDTILQVPPTAKPQHVALAPPASGAIFQSAAYRPLLEDRRARLVGDTMTILINEKTSAGKAEGSSGSKTGSVTAAAPSVFGIGLNRLSASATSADKFADAGAVTSSNNFTGTIGVTVVDILENGNLVVSGEKQVSLDKGIEYVRFSGVVSPDTIQTGNLVSSTQVADARVEYRTSSRIDAAEISSSLSRFFLSVLPF